MFFLTPFLTLAFHISTHLSTTADAQAVYIALQHLYSKSLSTPLQIPFLGNLTADPAHAHVNPANARAVLAASYLFGGMPELLEHAYSETSSALSSANVGEYVRWLGPRILSLSPSSGPTAPVNGNGSGNGFSFGTATPIGPGSGAMSRASSYPESDGAGDAYGEYSARLRADVLNFLLRTLPEQIRTTADGSLATDPRLMAAYVPLPFELFKQCVESPDLPISFMQDRFAFAKRAIAARKKSAASQQGPPMEESVVLALKDDGDGMAVHITRKPKRSRAALWKVEG